jgi:predicted dehydrogenase
VNGTTGTLFFSYDRLNELWYGDGRDDDRHYGLRRIRVEHPRHPETAGWWPIGQGIGYDATFINHVAGLAEQWETGQWSPGFDVGARVVRVCSAMERSVAERRWVHVEEVLGESAA